MKLQEAYEEAMKDREANWLMDDQYVCVINYASRFVYCVDKFGTESDKAFEALEDLEDALLDFSITKVKFAAKQLRLRNEKLLSEGVPTFTPIPDEERTE